MSIPRPTLAQARARITELEAEVERVVADYLRRLQLAVSQRDTLRHRIAELEGEWRAASDRCDRALIREGQALARIAELEAALYDQTKRAEAYLAGTQATVASARQMERNTAAARIAELEAEVARLGAACKAWEERYEDPSLSDREAMIYDD